MNIQIDGDEYFQKHFQTTDEIVEYIYLDGPAALTANTQFMLGSLLLSGFLFMVSQAVAAYYRKTAADAQKARHEEIMAKLDTLTKHPSVPALEAVLLDLKGTVEVELERDEVKLLEEPLQTIARDLPSIKIIKKEPGIGARGDPNP